MCTNDQEMNLKVIWLTVTPIWCITTPKTQISLRFLVCKSLWDKISEWPQNDVEHHNIKGNLHNLHYVRVPISVHFALQTAVSEFTYNLETFATTQWHPDDLKPPYQGYPLCITNVTESEMSVK